MSHTTSGGEFTSFLCGYAMHVLTARTIMSTKVCRRLHTLATKAKPSEVTKAVTDLGGDKIVWSVRTNDQIQRYRIE